MKRKHRPNGPEEEFAAWLDALTRGDAPASDRGGGDNAALGEIKATALYAHHVARHAALGRGERERVQEEIMATSRQPIERVINGRPGVGDRDDRHRTRVRLPEPLAHVRFSPLVSGAVVVVLLLAVAAGFAGMRRGFGPGSGNGQPASVPALAVLNAATVPNPQNCTAQPLPDAELQKIYMAPWKDRTNALPKASERQAVDAVDGGQILQVYEQLRDCSVAWATNQQNAVDSLLSPHAIQEMYWRSLALSGMYDTRSSVGSESSAATPTPQMGSLCGSYQCGTSPVSNSAFIWEPDISKTDTYFAQIHVDSMEVMTDGRVYAPVDWVNLEGKGPKAAPPVTGLVFIKIDGQWKLDDWIFGTQLLTDAGR